MNRWIPACLVVLLAGTALAAPSAPPRVLPTGEWYTYRVDPTHNVVRVDLAVDASDLPHFAYLWRHPIGDQPFYEATISYAEWTGEGWSIENVANLDRWWGDAPRIVLDSSGASHIFFITFASDGTDRALYVASRDAGVWTTTEIDSGGVGGSAPAPARSGGTWGVAYWASRTHQGEELRFAEGDGLEWGAPVTLGTFQSLRGLDMAYSASGVPHVVYVADSKVQHAWRPAGGWVNEVVADFSPGDTSVVGMHMLVAPGDVLQAAIGLYLQYDPDPRGSAAVFYFQHDAAGWSQESLATDILSCSPCSVGLAADSTGAPYVAYHWWGDGTWGANRILFHDAGGWRPTELPRTFSAIAFAFALGSDGTARYAWLKNWETTAWELWYATQHPLPEPSVVLVLPPIRLPPARPTGAGGGAGGPPDIVPWGYSPYRLGGTDDLRDEMRSRVASALSSFA